jgi:hypothetical protein
MVPAMNGRWQEWDATSFPSVAVTKGNKPFMVHKYSRMQLKMVSKDSDELARKTLKDVD